ncbi:DDE family transposase [Nitrospirillum amazonense]|uniref:DDE family transposase n=1 Tax=Nitrospirillum amazonense TaxID=28077 RepID=A0A560FGC6_9PROT|nr:DDE family transposase [Nitrospirillum amazonense]
MWSLRSMMPERSSWRVAQFDTLRLRLIKIAARVIEMKTQIKVHLLSATPYHIRTSCGSSSDACRDWSPDRQGYVPSRKKPRAFNPPDQCSQPRRLRREAEWHA